MIQVQCLDVDKACVGVIGKFTQRAVLSWVTLSNSNKYLGTPNQEAHTGRRALRAESGVLKNISQARYFEK